MTKFEDFSRIFEGYEKILQVLFNMLNLLLRYFESYSLKNNVTALPLNKETKGESTHPLPSTTKGWAQPSSGWRKFSCSSPIGPLSSFKSMQLQWLLAPFLCMQRMLHCSSPQTACPWHGANLSSTLKPPQKRLKEKIHCY